MFMDRDQWLQIGIDSGWISRPCCETHEGVPMSQWEENEFEQGYDPCVVVVRFYSDHDERNEVERNAQ